jgi:hypothetical protein
VRHAVSQAWLQEGHHQAAARLEGELAGVSFGSRRHRGQR